MNQSQAPSQDPASIHDPASSTQNPPSDTNSPSSVIQNQSSNHRPLVFVIIALTLVVLTATAYFYFKPKTPIIPSRDTNQSSNLQNPASPTPDPTAGWHTYTHPDYKFHISYPPDWTVREPALTLVGPTDPVTRLPTHQVHLFIYNYQSGTFQDIALQAGTSCQGNCPASAEDNSVTEGVDFRFLPPTVEEISLPDTRSAFKITTTNQVPLLLVPLPEHDKYLLIQPSKLPAENYNLVNQIFSTFTFLD